VAKTPRSTTKGKGRSRVKKEEEKPAEAEEDEDQKMEMEQPIVKDEQQDELAPDNTKADPF
jgi:hypothetical protein